MNRGLVSILCAIAAGAGVSLAANAAPQLEWKRVADLPDPVGRKGMYGGVSGGQVLLAGGSNFPVSQRDGGRKVFHRDVWVRAVGAAPSQPWRKMETQLPDAMGEGAAVATKFGVACVGGQNGNAAVAAAFLLTFNRRAGDVERMALPDLPERAGMPAAEVLDGWLYVAGGQGANAALRTFWRLDLANAVKAPTAAQWEKLPAWPGVARYGSFLVAVKTAGRSKLLFGGGIGGPAKSADDYLRDAALFDPATKQWQRAASLPRGAVLAATIALEDGRALVLGGSDGHDFARMRELGDRYRLPSEVLAYDVAGDRWAKAGAMPVGVVGATVADLGGSWLVAGGEFSPGLRTAQVHEMRVLDR